MDRTSAALGNTAAKFGTGHSQQVAKDPEERHVVRSVDTFTFAIDLQCHHDEPSRFAYHLRAKFSHLSILPKSITPPVQLGFHSTEVQSTGVHAYAKL